MEKIDYLHWNVVIKYMKVIPKERGKFTDCCGVIDIVNCAGYNKKIQKKLIIREIKNITL